MKIAINGCGIAGPALAYWLLRFGCEVLLVEQAPRLRSGGYVIDFWGVGFDVAERMGLIPRLEDVGYQVREVRFVDARGRRCGGFPVRALRRATGGRFTSLRRSDLAATIYGAIEGRVETVFGESIAGIEDDGQRVRVTFDRSAARDVDLVFGADGLHSRVRELAFGPEARFEASLGYHVAAFELQGYRPRDELIYVTYGIPGKQISRFSMRDDRTLCLFVFRDEFLPGRNPVSDEERKAALRTVFGDVAWECPRILDAMTAVGDVYFDRVSQIRMESWTKGRTALLGDAAACVSLLAGEGTGLAIAEAYVLAGELHRSSGNHTEAFARYQRLMTPLLGQKQRSAAGFASAFAPRTALGIGLRNFASRMMRMSFVADLLVGRNLRDDIVLPEYRL